MLCYNLLYDQKQGGKTVYNYQRLKDLREDNDLKQEAIAQMLEMTRQQYQLYESGKRQIPFDKVIKLAVYYNVSIDYIAGLTNEKEKNW